MTDDSESLHPENLDILRRFAARIGKDLDATLEDCLLAFARQAGWDVEYDGHVLSMDHLSDVDDNILDTSLSAPAATQEVTHMHDPSAERILIPYLDQILVSVSKLQADGGRVTSEQLLVLQAAMDRRVDEYMAAVNWLRERAEDEDAGRSWVLREAVEMVRILRRILPHLTLQQIHKAFGAPGDFGYETPIGAALAQLYRGGS